MEMIYELIVGRMREGEIMVDGIDMDRSALFYVKWKMRMLIRIALRKSG